MCCGPWAGKPIEGVTVATGGASNIFRQTEEVSSELLPLQTDFVDSLLLLFKPSRPAQTKTKCMLCSLNWYNGPSETYKKHPLISPSMGHNLSPIISVPSPWRLWRKQPWLYDCVHLSTLITLLSRTATDGYISDSLTFLAKHWNPILI